MTTPYELLVFPRRAEFLGQFSAYNVDLGHWRSLWVEFRRRFREVYVRGEGAVLLIHGGLGTGKTLFSRRLQQDFDRARQGGLQPDQENLWHLIVGDDPPSRAMIEKATDGSEMRRVEPSSGWLKELRGIAKNNQNRVKIFILDDAHKDVFMCEWAELSKEAYLGFKERRAERVVLESVAQKLVEDCRGDFQRSIFVLLSAEEGQMKALKEQIDRSDVGLARVLELPLPPPDIKEKIVRKNTNRLNRMSYWSCLDAAGKDERISVHDVLRGDRGFFDAFKALNDALHSETRRPGRPANRNLITLVTLGVKPSEAKNFIDEAELETEEHFRGDHLGVWWMRGQWASTLYTGSDAEVARRVRMMESEFALRWVALDMKATALLCQPSQVLASAQVNEIVGVVCFSPSIGKPEDVKRHGVDCESLDRDIKALVIDIAAFAAEFVRMGQLRSRLYETALARHFARYGSGVPVFPSLKPDAIIGAYKPCAITAAVDHAGIMDAIRREGHTIEFTAHLREDMRGLTEYLLDKVDCYAKMLESV